MRPTDTAGLRGCPLDTAAHVRAALSMLHKMTPSEWPRILGAASGYGIISPARAKEILLRGKTASRFCSYCMCWTQITCPWCGEDACAKCWKCPTPSCGEHQEQEPAPEAAEPVTAESEGAYGIPQHGVQGAGYSRGGVSNAWMFADSATCYQLTANGTWEAFGTVAGSIEMRLI